MTSPLEPPRTLLGRGSWRESARVATSSRMDVTWVDVFGLGLLAAIGFTESLLIGELAFGACTARDE